MLAIVVLTGVFLAILGVFCPKKFQLYGVLTAIIFTILSIELIADTYGLTLCFLIALSVMSLTPIKINIKDVLGCLIIIIPCIFWLNTQEYVDGFAYSYAILGIGVAIIGNLIFDRQKRQPLCAIALLTSLVVCFMSNNNIYTIDIAMAFLVVIIFTESLSKNLNTSKQYDSTLKNTMPFRLT